MLLKSNKKNNHQSDTQTNWKLFQDKKVLKVVTKREGGRARVEDEY